MPASLYLLDWAVYRPPEELKLSYSEVKDEAKKWQVRLFGIAPVHWPAVNPAWLTVFLGREFGSHSCLYKLASACAALRGEGAVCVCWGL